MIVLLPPSEGKTAPASGVTFDPGALANAQLNPARAKVLDSLTRMCTNTQHKALKVLGLSTNQRDAVTANAELTTAPADHALRVYTGVLFAALDYPSLTTAQQGRANERLLVVSSLFGIVKPDDLIPAYRLPGSTTLPRIGRVDTFWRRHLERTMPELVGDQLVVDMRSGTYVKFWPIPTLLAPHAATIKIWQIGPGGSRTAVSHHNKSTKGEVARILASSPSAPSTPDDAVDLLRGHGWDATRAADPKLPHARLDVTIA
ncbi:MAG: peroxide stress protein YaaA [Candidatus Nanopelagicales bacterium]